MANNFSDVDIDLAGNDSKNNLYCEMMRTVMKEVCKPREDYIVRMVLFFLFILFGIIGNSALLFIILKDRHLRNAPNILICNLAVADLLYILVTGPIKIKHEINPCWFAGHTTCVLRFYAPIVCQCACVYSLVALSRERYSAIVNGIHLRMHHQMGIAICWALVSWMFGVIIASPIWTVNFAHLTSCDYLCRSFKLAKSAKIFQICDFLFLYIIPFVTMLVHYIITSKFLLSSTQNFEQNRTIRRQIKSRRRLAYISIAMSVFFCVFWLPYYVYNFILHFNLRDVSNKPSFIPFRHFHYYMSLANSSLNPWLLFILSSTHRKRLIRCLTCKSRPNRLQRQTTSQTTLSMKLRMSLRKSGTGVNTSSSKNGSGRGVNEQTNSSDAFGKGGSCQKKNIKEWQMQSMRDKNTLKRRKLESNVWGSYFKLPFFSILIIS